MSTHGNTGNKNALRVARSAAYSLRLRPELKSASQKVAEQGESLADIIEIALAKEILLRNPRVAESFGLLPLLTQSKEEPEPLPRWTSGLMRRTAECLVKAGFAGKVEVRKRAQDGFEFGRLSNWGPRCTEDLINWL